jgi:hypothetical protein
LGLHAEPNAFEVERLAALRQLEILYRMLGEICEVAEPDQNLTTFGHKIRNFLILASTEVEAQCKGVLKANGYAKNGNLNIMDYGKLAGPMRLSGYTVRFSEFPNLPAISPFSEWGSEGQLFWYKAYNSVKHDREQAFAQATLKAALNAFAGCLVMYVAQFGLVSQQLRLGTLNDRFSVGLPEFEANDFYIGNVGLEDGAPVTRLHLEFPAQ